MTDLDPLPRVGLRTLIGLAEERGGLFTTRRAADAGITSRVLTYYVRRHDLERLAHGVYRLAHLPPHVFEDVLVACLWAGLDAAASHETAFVLHGLTDVMPSSIHVTRPRPFRGHRDGVVVHHCDLRDEDVEIIQDVPTTTIERTLSDVLTADRHLTTVALNEAMRLGRTSHRQLTRHGDDRLLALALAQ